MELERPDPHIDQLHDSILLEIFSYVPIKELCICKSVCRRWRNIVYKKTLWRHVNLLPHEIELRQVWKLVRRHFSGMLRVLRVRGVLDKKTGELKPGLTDCLLRRLSAHCPNLWCLHIEQGSVSTMTSVTLLPKSLTHLILRKCRWKKRRRWVPSWLSGAHRHLESLVYLDLSYGTNLLNRDMQDVSEMTSLRILKLDKCLNVTEDGLVDVVKKLTQLTSLSLKGMCTNLVVQCIGLHLKALEDLDLSNSRALKDGAVCTMVGSLPRLRYLYLKDCPSLTKDLYSMLRSVSLISVLLPQ